MSNLISVVAGFQYAVNIAYDLHNEEKIAGFIPTRSALELWLEVLNSTDASSASSAERSRVLVAPYGRGKSHLVLTMLALLSGRKKLPGTSLNTAIARNSELNAALTRYRERGERLLPIIISGTSTSISQAFLLALERALRDNDMAGLMPETNYLAAIRTINRWKNEYPETFAAFAAAISLPADEFMARLAAYDSACYTEFERLYPTLTAGGVFSPFLGFDVVELYRSVLRALRGTEYTGIFVAYDEFSKFLEANIAAATATDMKVLQDFAEMCNRTSSEGVTAEILLIAHKDIESYIGELPRARTDGWRAVANRFRHVYLRPDYAESYELMQAAIRHSPHLWERFRAEHGAELSALASRYQGRALFRELADSERAGLIYGCYPLHPMTSFILPRLSERVAQNERTLFTFLAAEAPYTLRDFLRGMGEGFSLLTPDFIFDYFRPLLAKETGALRELYLQAERVLAGLEDELAARIVKNIALIYMLEQFECLVPTQASVIECLEWSYPIERIEAALTALIEQKYVIYLKRSNGFLALKQSSGVDICAKIADCAERHRAKSTRELAAALGLNYYIYPAQYNDEHEMTRYFPLELVDAGELTAETIASRTAQVAGDGVLYAVVAGSLDELASAREVAEGAREVRQAIFALPREAGGLHDAMLELYAARELREGAGADAVLAAEYALVEGDLYEVVREWVAGYIYPERARTTYYHLGREVHLRRRASLSQLATKICDFVYAHTPVINNEVINKNSISLQAIKSRLKVLAAILRTEVEPDLGLVGYGQDVSIMRSTLLRTGILADAGGGLDLRLVTGNEHIDYLLGVINDFILRASESESLSFGELYAELTGTECGLGVRLGIIPIFIAVVLRRYKDSALIYENGAEQQLTAETLQRLNEAPTQFTLKRIAWSEPRTEYVRALAAGLELPSAADYRAVVVALRAWYLALPKYSRERRRAADGTALARENLRVMRALRAGDNAGALLFSTLPEIFAMAPSAELAARLLAVKADYDGALAALAGAVTASIYAEFSAGQDARASLPSVLMDFADTLGAGAFTAVYADGTGDFLALCRAGLAESELVERIARLASGLRLTDWADATLESFTSTISGYRAAAEQAGAASAEDACGEQTADGYSVTFVDDAGRATVRTFARTEYSARARLLLNSLLADLEAMGTAITAAEKRQVVIEVLERLC